MRKFRVFGLVLIGIILLTGLRPFAGPIPPLTDIRSIDSLADDDSRFAAINGLKVHDKEMDSGEPEYILLNGSGVSTYSWREVMQPLADQGRVIAYDRFAFGLTQRPMPAEWSEKLPDGMLAQVAALIGLMDHLDIERDIWVGNLAGGTVAIQAALDYPEHFHTMELVDAAINTGNPFPNWVSRILRTPQIRHIGPLIARQIKSSSVDFLKSAWHDPEKLSAEVIGTYQLPHQVDIWVRALWQLTASDRGLDLLSRLVELNLTELVISGDDDQIVPVQQSIQLAGAIRGAHLGGLYNSGHIPQKECPSAFLESILALNR